MAAKVWAAWATSSDYRRPARARRIYGKFMAHVAHTYSIDDLEAVEAADLVSVTATQTATA
jgi:hypothetical protein